jgi:hypothetical protein
MKRVIFGLTVSSSWGNGPGRGEGAGPHRVASPPVLTEFEER